MGLDLGSRVQRWRHPTAWRTGLFLVALGSILWASRAPRVWVAAAFVFYVVTATLWIRGQHEDNQRRRPWQMPLEGLIGLALLTVGLFVYRFSWVAGDAEDNGERWFAAGLLAAGPLYVLSGFLVTRLRRSQKLVSFAWFRTLTRGRRIMWRSALGWLFVGLAVAGGFTGLALLGRGPGWTATLLVLILLLPPGASLLAENRIASRNHHAVTAVAGVVMFAAVTLTAWQEAESDLVLVAFAAVAVLAFAIASSTLVDVAIVLAVIAFVGITPRQERSPTTPDDSAGTLVALGDSYMSGEGASTFYERTDEGGGNGCRRAPTAWAAVAGQQSPFTGLEFLACSGARTYNVRLPDDDPPDESPEPKPHEQRGEGDADENDTQLQQYVDRHPEEVDRTPRLVVISIGGNDSGFGTIGLMCVAPGDCSEKASLWYAGLDQVGKNLAQTFREIDDTFPDEVPILVVPYPDPVYGGNETVRDGRPANCADVALGAGERAFIGEFVRRLDKKIERAAADARFHYLGGMVTALADAGLQLCHPLNDGRPGLNFIGLRSVNGDPSQRFNPSNWTHNSLHPNERGHAAMLRVFQQWVDAHLRGPDPLPRPPAPTGSEEIEKEKVQDPPLCDVYADLESRYYSDPVAESCIGEGRDWAAQESGRHGALITSGVIIAGWGAWLVSTAFFAWRRTRRAVLDGRAGPAERPSETEGADRDDPPRATSTTEA